jgi:hypothetical protein
MVTGRLFVPTVTELKGDAAFGKHSEPERDVKT